MRHAAIGSAPAPLHAGRRLGSSAPAAAVARPHRTRAGARCRWRLAPSALGGAEPSLVTLPVFPLPNVLHPTQQGVISVFEPRYLALFRAVLEEHPGGRGGRFLHVLSPAAAPPALLDNAVGGLPRIGCCAEVEAIEERPDGTLLVQYAGARRVQLLLSQQEEPFTRVAAEWYDDDPAGELDPTVDVLERETAKLLLQIERLLLLLSPGEGALPEAVRRYSPPAAVAKKTSYDALKAAGHRAAGHIDMWRRHGSVYKTQSQAPAAASDPYEAIREALGKARRQELFSFAAAQLLVMGTPERAALMLNQDTGTRLNFVIAALRPYFLELQAKASLKRGLE
ncbi:ATP-dependent protease [Micractinium conductrix]|uniref:ATP-dependent protease n=1 Tax=Micractinium conductrix TaxID=554055 RepID=A0A2P6VBV7_9CHLO|nr:ATP-dependent protease [Micractinium conductrix]|eukprot:PSC71566.1 ATP-dependent protease [Micractinium conductrix]